MGRAGRQNGRVTARQRHSLGYRDGRLNPHAHRKQPRQCASIAGSAQIWRALEACGLPDILGVWNHEAGPATRFTVIQIKQRYPGTRATCCTSLPTARVERMRESGPSWWMKI